MPINYADYPPNWKEISARIRFERAGGRCEGSPAFPYCRAEHGRAHPDTGSKVVLTVAHLDHDIKNNADDNLRAMCQRCHLSYDAEHHARNAARTRRKKALEAGQLEINFEEKK